MSMLRELVLSRVIYGGGSTLGNSNLLTGCTFTPGYLVSGGTISPQLAGTLEVTSSEVDISALNGEDIWFQIGHDGTDQEWVAIGYYNADHQWISRSAGATTAQGSAPTPAGAKYIRVSFRTYGNCAIYVAGQSSFCGLMTETIENAGGTAVTA